jgi:hypothetical protein
VYINITTYCGIKSNSLKTKKSKCKTGEVLESGKFIPKVPALLKKQDTPGLAA